MLNITELGKEQQITPIWRLAFRPFFLFGALFSSVSILFWGLFLAGKVSFTPYADALFWHSHEMLFGFVSIFIIGFLLTAGQTWTGRRSIHGMPLVGLFMLWLAGRVLMFLGGPLPAVVVAIIDLSFIPFAAFYFYRMVKSAGNKRNLFFVPILLLIFTANLLFHLSHLLQNPFFKVWGTNAVLMLIGLVMTIVAGRVMPMFTANGSGTPKVEPIVWIEKSAIGSVIVLAVCYVSGLAYWLPDPLMAVLFSLAAITHLLRVIRWKPWVTLRFPLLWSLHLAYWFIPLAFSLFALYKFGWLAQQSIAVHALTAGAMGSMILSIICRVSLGHTGRPLTPPYFVTLALFFVVLAGGLRSLGMLSGMQVPLLLSVASGLWCLAYLLFVLGYARILLSPRIDGRPG